MQPEIEKGKGSQRELVFLNGLSVVTLQKHKSTDCLASVVRLKNWNFSFICQQNLLFYLSKTKKLCGPKPQHKFPVCICRCRKRLTGHGLTLYLKHMCKIFYCITYKNQNKIYHICKSYCSFLFSFFFFFSFSFIFFALFCPFLQVSRRDKIIRPKPIPQNTILHQKFSWRGKQNVTPING